jgi:adenine/guanine phosphoribosyltransferase-like PRPP-binding protein
VPEYKYYIDYLFALDPCQGRKAIARGVKALSALDFDAIAFTGTSGGLLAPAIAYEMNKGLIVVKKGKSHSSLRVEGCVRAATYVIVDDFISTGNTVRRIARHLRNDFNAKHAELIGIYECAAPSPNRGRLTTPRNIAQKHPVLRGALKDIFTKYGVKQNVRNY